MDKVINVLSSIASFLYILMYGTTIAMLMASREFPLACLSVMMILQAFVSFTKKQETPKPKRSRKSAKVYRSE